MKSIYHKQEDGRLAITAFLDDDAADKAIEVFKKNKIAFGQITESTKIESLFFDAYTVSDNGSIAVDITAAQEIQKDQWRGMRTPLLQQLDIEYMKAIESGNAQQQELIAQKKQLLRDVTQTAMPHNLEEIKQCVPSILQDQCETSSTQLDENGMEISG
jgi:hypothetical protein